MSAIQGAHVTNAANVCFPDEHGIAKIVLGVDSNNKAGIRAYLKVGFRADHGRNFAEGESSNP
jgi:RimJ/RimL family protein N-acetyltransferase